MSPAAEGILRRLDGTRQKWWLFTFLTTAMLAGSLSLAQLLVLMLADAYYRFSQVVLAALFGAWLLVTVAIIVWLVRRVARSHRSLEATARRIEDEFPELGSNLMNLVQLSQDSKNVDRAFCAAAVSEAARSVMDVPLEKAAAQETRWRRFRLCMQTPGDLGESFVLLAALVAIAITCHLMVPNWGSAASRLLAPWEFTPSVGSVKIVKVTPGNTEILTGSSLEIGVEIRNPEAVPYKATLFFTPEGEKQNSVAMGANEGRVLYKVTLPSVLKPLKYRLEVGDSQTEIFHVAMREKPTVAEVEVTLHYPEYLGRADDTFRQKTADLEGAQFAVATLAIHPNTPIAKGYLQCGPQRYNGTVSPGGMLLTAKLPLLKDGSFTIHLANDAGHTDPDPRVNRIRVLPDASPTVQLLKPPRQSTAAPGGDQSVLIRAGDDHAVGRVRLEMKVVEVKEEEDADASARRATEVLPARVVQDWTKFEGTTSVLLPHRLELDAKKIKPGQTVMVRAVAWDKRDFNDWGVELKPQEASTEWHSIRIVDEQKKMATALEQLDSVRGALWKIFENQVRARVKAAMIPKREKLAEQTALAGEVRGDQVEIQKASAALASQIGAKEKDEQLEIKRVLGGLAAGEMVEAVRRGDDLQKTAEPAGFVPAVAAINKVQDQIIEVLRKLLNEIRKAQADVLAESPKRPVGDLPNDTKQKLEDLKAKLEEFLKQQKKVIEATTNLAKKPVEDFTEEEEQLLKGMAAQQDEWSKFMKDFQTDLSKLPDQDFANSSLAHELVEIQTELKMAEDALLKKSADIAVPLEQLGYEKAQELTSNMEKWLPDTPDREKWSQEEALTDADKEAPMAELPAELEDLIGDLMEGEEDLFDEMEDVSSSAIDSADKGVGWDASDGPISDNSAKGVTGNRLPNTSEIGGRAGEGRSGKSSGEFVGDEAVGKGGRKTPSRLTPDPYVKGQIKDHSKDPQGGASGGGKESGQGGEGLEGPSPGNTAQRDMERLAGKQAALRNKAEGVDVKMQVGKYHHTDLKNLMEMMSQVERDLRAGRYQNALRQRQEITKKLGNVKQYLEGEFQVKQDATTNLPKDIQKELLGSMQDPSPVGWEEINREYYERLATGGGSPPVADKPAADAAPRAAVPAKKE